MASRHTPWYMVNTHGPNFESVRVTIPETRVMEALVSRMQQICDLAKDNMKFAQAQSSH